MNKFYKYEINIEQNNLKIINLYNIKHNYTMKKISKNYIKKLALFLFLTLIAYTSYSQNKSIANNTQINQNQNTNIYKKYTFEILNNKDKTFGYKIFADGKAMIMQESMPAVPGNKGFPRKKDAERMANLVIYKLQNNIMPPTVSVSEVDSIKAIK